MPGIEKAKYISAFLISLGAFAWVGASLPEPPPPLKFESLGPIEPLTSEPPKPAGQLKIKPPSLPKTAAAKPSKKQPPSLGSISLNLASSTELQRIPGIGPATAQKIIAYRTKKGRFRSLNELTVVKGIGPKKLKAMRVYLHL